MNSGRISPKEAAYYQGLDEDRVKCLLCPHECIISPGKTGICQGRINQQGLLYTKNYGQISSIGVDPIEKKPLYHFYPGSRILSVGTYGCNFKCSFCQNWQISQQKPQLREVSPEKLVKLAIQSDSIGIAFTYSEPSVWFEYILETGKLSKEKGLKNVLVTNGYLNHKPLRELLPIIDGANIDLKSFNDDFYKKICGGTLEPVLNNIKELFENRIHLELTTLIIPELNDSPEEIMEMVDWIKALSPEIPIHLSRYFPRYKLNKEATPVVKMEEFYQLASRHLNYVYLGNLQSDYGTSTYCPDCGEKVIIRDFYSVKNKLEGNKCPVCGYRITGIF